ncbi:hypothetical protein AN191_08335 [Loktanella sp. 5RATIMAR09]|uniref:DUF2332 domain-containing protein n=1 Tax=Loktanella sp. 5RATIMAR09 TaxID=1225655 RepID=UPI0006EB85B9|nr:DUF2332 family protein [Loktanella sp. 5RATIMAR09]KQI72142.1 hypothetical protein AN191_08335 [Loktanella sp. 5RATIMAR09]
MTPTALQEAFLYQSKACISLGSPFMGRLMTLCATMAWPAGIITDRIFAWQGDIGPRGQSVPLRLAGALHALHLQEHAGLGAVYPPQDATDTALWGAVSTVLVAEADHINTWLDDAPQTNEVRRSATLIAVGHVLAERYGLPIRTSELGASGGLNLHWDAYALAIRDQKFGADEPALTLSPDWHGPLPPATRSLVASHGGVDINPLDPHNPDDALRLQAYLWADQPERLALTGAAMATAQTPVDKGDAIDWLAPRLAHVSGQTHLIYSTVAWQYFPAEKQALGTNLIAAAGATATKNTPLAWFSMENDGSTQGAALTLRLWPGDLTLHLGRADFHGRWVEWTAT